MGFSSIPLLPLPSVSWVNWVVPFLNVNLWKWLFLFFIHCLSRLIVKFRELFGELSSEAGELRLIHGCGCLNQ